MADENEKPAEFVRDYDVSGLEKDNATKEETVKNFSSEIIDSGLMDPSLPYSDYQQVWR